MTSNRQKGATLEGASPRTQHILPTRLVHAGLTAAIITQLFSSQFMDPDGAGNFAFEVHEYSGLAALALTFAFWLLAVVRRRGTPLGLLIPWFSGRRIAALWDDIRSHISAAMKGRFPRRTEDSPLASATHGLGLLLMTAMAASGTLYYFINTGDPDAGGLVGVTMYVHTTLAALVWAYLVGHAAMALLAHYAGSLSIASIWSFRSRGPQS